MIFQPKREKLLLPINLGDGLVQDEEWDYLSIYDPSGRLLARSAPHRAEDFIQMNYDGLSFIVFPAYDNEVLVVWDTLVKKFGPEVKRENTKLIEQHEGNV